MSFWRSELLKLISRIKALEAYANGESLTVTMQDNGAAGGPDFYLFRDSDSPQGPADVGGRVIFQFRDSVGNIINAGYLLAILTDPTAGSMDTSVQLYNKVGGGDNLGLNLIATGIQIPALGATSPGTIRGTSVQATNWFGTTAPRTVTTDFTVGATDNHIISNRAATNTGTLPAAGSFTGREITIKTIQAQLVNSVAANVIPLAGGAAGTAILSATAGKWAQLVSNGSNWEIMAGN